MILHRPSPSNFALEYDACILVSMANSPPLQGDVWSFRVGIKNHFPCLLPRDLPWSHDFGWFCTKIIVLAISSLRNSCAPVQHCPGHHLVSDKPSCLSAEQQGVNRSGWKMTTKHVETAEIAHRFTSSRFTVSYKFCIGVTHSPPKQVPIYLWNACTGHPWC